MPIVLLPQDIINQIAAGEVVERPSSVVKELIENALDSGADRIDVQIYNSGKTLICVRDNGCGMCKEDIILSVKRHATSKLPDFDLDNISSFGFRGEALAAIGSISRMSIKSWTDGNENGWQLDVAGSENFSISPIACGTKGSYVEVKDLFFATPARLKFLKSDGTELVHCVDIFKRLALANHNVGFKLVSDNSISFDFASTDNFGLRVKEVIDERNFEDMCAVDFSSDNSRVFGFCSLPTANSATTSHQYIFVNGRAVRDKFINSAISIAYRDLVPMGRYACAVLFIEVNPMDLDVNAHPAKTEVRFRRGLEVKNDVIHAIKSAVSPYSNRTSVSLGKELIENVIGKKHTAKQESLGQLRLDAVSRSTADISYDAPTPKGFVFNDISVDRTANASQAIKNEVNPIGETPINGLFSTNDLSLGEVIGQAFGCYILAQTKNDLIIVDQHAAHERLLYERFKDTHINNLKVQQLLVPEVIEVDSELVLLAVENRSDLTDLGVGIDKLDNSHLIVRYIPVDVVVDIPVLVNDILGILKNEKVESFDHVLRRKLLDKLATFSCHSSIKGGRHLSFEQMNSILRSIESNRNMGQCNHGRPSYVKIEVKDIEKLFMRH